MSDTISAYNDVRFAFNLICSVCGLCLLMYLFTYTGGVQYDFNIW